MIKNEELLIQFEEVLDSSSLLEFYFKEIAKDKNELKNIKKSFDSYRDFLIEMLTHNGEIYSKKIKQIEDLDAEIKIFLDSINPAPKSITILNAKLKELKNLRKHYEKELADLKAYRPEVEKTIEILTPIENKFKLVLKKLNSFSLRIYRFRFERIGLNILTVILVSFVINFLLDSFSMFAESTFLKNHFYIIAGSFFIQLFLIDPYILSKLKSNLNWRLIKKIRSELPNIEKSIKEDADELNSLMSAYQELSQFKIVFEK